MFGMLLGGLSAVLGGVAKLVPTVIKIVGTELVTFAKALEAFFTALGILKPGENVEEIGDRALQAEEDELEPITVENSGSYEKYQERLAEYDRLDPEKSALITQEQKLHKGLEVLMGVSIEKFGEPLAALFPIILRDPTLYSTTGRLEGLAKVAQEDKRQLEDIVGYISGSSRDSAKNDNAFDALSNIERQVNPDATEQEIRNTIESLFDKK